MKKIALKREIAAAAYQIAKSINSGNKIHGLKASLFKNKFGKDSAFLIYNFTLKGKGFEISGCKIYHSNWGAQAGYSNVDGEMEFVNYYIRHFSSDDRYANLWLQRMRERG